jgi:hypothetical protein
MKMASKSFENVTEFLYFGLTPTNQNGNYGEVKGRLNLGDACYHPLRNLLCSHLLSTT